MASEGGTWAGRGRASGPLAQQPALFEMTDEARGTGAAHAPTKGRTAGHARTATDPADRLHLDQARNLVTVIANLSLNYGTAEVALRQLLEDIREGNHHGLTRKDAEFVLYHSEVNGSVRVRDLWLDESILCWVKGT